MLCRKCILAKKVSRITFIQKLEKLHGHIQPQNTKWCEEVNEAVKESEDYHEWMCSEHLQQLGAIETALAKGSHQTA